MKKITLLLFIVILLGGAFVSFWIYNRYFKKEIFAPLTYVVRRGDLREELRVRGEVSADREYDLSFNSFGNVAQVGVEEGQDVKQGEFLMRLDTTTSTLELTRLLAERLQAKALLANAQAVKANAFAAVDAATAQLSALKRGALPETVEVQTAQTEAAKLAVTGTENVLLDTVNVAYTSADDAVRTTADQMFDNPRTSHPTLAFLIVDDSLRSTLELQRLALESVLNNWQSSLQIQTIDASKTSSNAQANLETVSTFLDNLALALNAAMPSENVTESVILGWQADVSQARTSINTASANVTNAETARQAASATLAVSENQLTALKAGAATEEISVQEALVRQAEAQITSADAGISQAQSAIAVIDASIGIANKKIRDASLFAPADAVITKIWVKENEQYQQSLEGMPAISLATSGLKVQSEISELDIPKIHAGNGNPVTVVFDAFPNRTYTGVIVSVEPKEIVRDTDTYYRVNITLAEPTDDIRRRMSADVVIHIAEKKNTLFVPLFMVTKREDRYFVTVQKDNVSMESEVQIGIANAEFVEIISGVDEGDTLVAPPA